NRLLRGHHYFGRRDLDQGTNRRLPTNRIARAQQDRFAHLQFRLVPAAQPITEMTLGADGRRAVLHDLDRCSFAEPCPERRAPQTGKVVTARALLKTEQPIVTSVKYRVQRVAVAG